MIIQYACVQSQKIKPSHISMHHLMMGAPFQLSLQNVVWMSLFLPEVINGGRLLNQTKYYIEIWQPQEENIKMDRLSYRDSFSQM
jgi:hypothetical protein